MLKKRMKKTQKNESYTENQYEKTRSSDIHPVSAHYSQGPL